MATPVEGSLACRMALLAMLLAVGCAGPDQRNVSVGQTLAGNPRLWTEPLEKQLERRKWKTLKNRRYAGYVILQGRLDLQGNFHPQKIVESWPNQSREAMAETLSRQIQMDPVLVGSHILPSAEAYAIFYEDASPQVVYVYGRQLETVGPTNVAEFISPIITHLYFEPILITSTEKGNFKKPFENLPQASADIFIKGNPDEDSSASTLLVFLHGMGGNPADLEPQLREFANAENINVFLPSGSITMQWRPDNQLAQTWDPGRDADALIEKIRQLPEMAREHVYLAGFSAGANMSYVTGIRYPDFFEAIIAFSGAAQTEYLPAAKLEKAATALPVVIVHGTSDTVMPPELAIQAREFLESHGFEVELISFDGGHRLPGSFREILVHVME